MAFHANLQEQNWTFRRVVWATLVLVFIALCFWLLYRFNQVIFILFIAFVVGTVIRLIVTWLHRQGLPQITSAILAYFLLFVLLVSFILMIFPLVIVQSTTIAAAVPGYYQSLREWMVNYPNQLIVHLSEFLPVTLPGLDPKQQTNQQILASAGQALGYLSSVVKSVLILSAILLIAFHWTINGPRTISSLLLLVPKDQQKNIGELILTMETKVGYYIAGQGVLCLIIGIMALVAYLIIGLPNALVLAIVAGVLEAVPIIGPLLGAIPAAIIAFSIAPSKLIWVVVATFIIQQVENSLLVPRVMRKAVGVNPFVSLLSIFAFSTLFGISGSLMAIPIAAIIQLLLNQFVFNPGTMESEVSTGRDYASRLRYETQYLVQDLRKQARLKKKGSDQWINQTDQAMDEIETITTDLDSLLAQINTTGTP